jgi:DNA-binding transcriptional LysR family regulator
MPEQSLPTSRKVDGMDLTLHQLKLFHTVAQHLSYTRAAEQLYLSQPAVSQQIKTIEQQIGLRLFVRHGRGIVLTPEGRELLRHVERLLALFAETAPLVRDVHQLKRGTVSMGASASAGTYVVPVLLGAFHARYPGIHITLTVANHPVIEECLLKHQVDLVVVSLIEQHERFVIEHLAPYELVVVASPSHPLTERSALPLDVLEGETLLQREQGAGTRYTTEQFFTQAGIVLPSSLEFGSNEAIKEGAIAELGIAILPLESVADEVARGDLVILDVQGFPLERHWYVVHLKGRRLSLAAAALRQFLLKGQRASP